MWLSVHFQLAKSVSIVGGAELLVGVLSCRTSWLISFILRSSALFSFENANVDRNCFWRLKLLLWELSLRISAAGCSVRGCFVAYSDVSFDDCLFEHASGAS